MGMEWPGLPIGGGRERGVVAATAYARVQGLAAASPRLPGAPLDPSPDPEREPERGGGWVPEVAPGLGGGSQPWAVGMTDGAVPAAVGDAASGRGSVRAGDGTPAPLTTGRGRHRSPGVPRAPVATAAGAAVLDRLPPRWQALVVALGRRMSPLELRSGRAGLESGHVVLLVVLTLGAIGAGLVVLRAAQSDVVPLRPPAVVPVTTALPTAATPAAAPAFGSLPVPAATPLADPTAAPGVVVTGAPTAVATAAPDVVVHVVGRVRDPGVVRVPVGSRVVDAVQAAGGALPGVAVTSLNLARPVLDGEQVVVGLPPGSGAPLTAVPTLPSGSPIGTVAEPTEAAPLDLNTATVEQLETLPGIGEVLAQSILDWRTENGGFTAVEELLEVSGIGDTTLADIEDLVRV